MNQRLDMQYSEAMSTCNNLGGELVKSPLATDPKWMTALVNFIGLYYYKCKHFENDGFW